MKASRLLRDLRDAAGLRLSSPSLKTQFALASGALLLVFSLAFATWTLHVVEADLRASVIEVQRTLVRSTSSDIEARVAQRRDAMTTIAPLLEQAAPSSGAEMDAFFRPRPVLKKMFDAVLVADAAGRVMYDMPAGGGDSCVGRSLAGRDFFKQVLAGAPLTLSSPFAPLTGNEACLVFASPLRSGGGPVTGALVGVIHVAKGGLLGDIGKLRIGRDGYFAIVEVSDRPLYVLHVQPELIGTPAPGGATHPVMAEARQGGEGVFEGATKGGGLEALRTFKPLRAAPWVVVAVYPTTEAFAGLRAREQQAAWVSAALCAGATIAAWLLARWLLRPVGRLQRLMERHSSNPGMPIAEQSFGSSELMALAGAYNAQAASRLGFESRLIASERHLQAVMDNIPARIAYVDDKERYTFVNDHIDPGVDRDPKAMRGRTMREVWGESGYARLAPYVARTLAGHEARFESTGWNDGRTFHYQTTYVPDRDAEGQVRGFHVLVFDISEQKHAQERLALLATSDALTGLPNRFRVDEKLPQAQQRCASAGRALAVMFIDIDHFKSINDTLGHAAGDAVLKEFAVRLQRTVRSTDTVARLGGDEFVVILEGLQEEEDALKVARNVLAEVDTPFHIGGRTLAVTASVGVVFDPQARLGAKELLAQADAALYRVKAGGRNDCYMVVASDDATPTRKTRPIGHVS